MAKITLRVNGQTIECEPGQCILDVAAEHMR